MHIANIGIVCTGCAACVVLGGRDGACHIAARNAGCFIVAHVVAARNAPAQLSAVMLTFRVVPPNAMLPQFTPATPPAHSFACTVTGMILLEVWLNVVMIFKQPF